MLDDLKYTPIAIGLRNLRHLYEQMVAGQVSDCDRAARGLLGPAIAQVEAAEQGHDDEVAKLRELLQVMTEYRDQAVRERDAMRPVVDVAGRLVDFGEKRSDEMCTVWELVKAVDAFRLATGATPVKPADCYCHELTPLEKRAGDICRPCERLATGASKGSPVAAALDATEDRFQARLAAYREETAALSSPRVEPAPRPADACSDCPAPAVCDREGCFGPEPTKAENAAAEQARAEVVEQIAEWLEERSRVARRQGLGRYGGIILGRIEGEEAAAGMIRSGVWKPSTHDTEAP